MRRNSPGLNWPQILTSEGIIEEACRGQAGISAFISDFLTFSGMHSIAGVILKD